MQKFTLSNSLENLHLKPAFDKMDDYIIANAGHWNSKGHYFAANAIYNFLKDNQIITIE